MRVLVVFVFFGLLPSAAPAGPWPREEGKVFAAVSFNVRERFDAVTRLKLNDPHTYNSAYVEYGATPRLTFVLDAGFGHDGSYSALLIGRRAFGPAAARSRLALSFGAGLAAQSGQRAEPQVQIGGGIGRGFRLDRMPGWAALDLSATWRTSSGDTIVKADLTLGLKPTPRWHTILQLQSGKYPGSAAYLRLAPSVVRQIGPGRHVEFGLDADLVGGERIGLKLGTWMTF